MTRWATTFGRVRAAQERFDEAIEQYRQADALWQKKGSKDRKFALRNWVEALRLQEHYEQAAEKCQEAIGLDPEFPDAYHTFGLVRAAQERFDEAIEQYRQADALWQKKGSKDRKFALRNWADALRLQEHYEQAAEKCQEAIGIDRHDPLGYILFGLVRAAQERFDEAIEQYRQADALWQKKGSKDRKFALWYWVEALRLQEHYEQAAEKCQEAIGIDPEFPDAYNSFGLVRAAQERFDEAIELYRQADALWQTKGSKDRKFALCYWAEALSPGAPRTGRREVPRGHRPRSGIPRRPTTVLAWYARRRSALTKRSSNTVRRTRCGRRRGPRTGNMPCGIGDGPFASRRNSRTRRPNSIVPRKSSRAMPGRFAFMATALPISADTRMRSHNSTRRPRSTGTTRGRAIARQTSCSGLVVTRKVGRNGGRRGNAMSAGWTESCAARSTCGRRSISPACWGRFLRPTRTPINYISGF